jgi:hypothetical protein
MGKAWRCDFEDSGAEEVGPVGWWEVTESGTIDDGGVHGVGRAGFEELWVVVAEGDGGDLSVSVVMGQTS